MKRKAKHKKPARYSKKQTVKTRNKPSSIEFCERCGSILVPIKKDRDTYLKCRGCGRQTKKDVKGLKIIEEKKRQKGVLVIEKDMTLLPLTDKACPKCEYGKAYWWMQQTRSADEPPTQFFRCEKCKHTWREYK
jgi:DNA-directed RNA polymerase subunit M